MRNHSAPMTTLQLVRLLRDNPRLFASHAARKLGLAKGPSPLSNVEYNRYLWDGYSDLWTKQTAPVATDRESYPEALGDEWGRVADVDKVVEEYVFPYIDERSAVAEIGVGGGRIAARVASKCGHLHCYDISPKMLERAKDYLVGRSNVSFA